MFSVAPETWHCVEIHIRNSSLSVFFFSSHFSFQLLSLLFNKPAPDLLLKIHTKDWGSAYCVSVKPWIQIPCTSQAQATCACNRNIGYTKAGEFHRAHWLACLANQQAPDPVWDSFSNRQTTERRWVMTEKAGHFWPHLAHKFIYTRTDESICHAQG